MKTKLEMAHEWAIELLRIGYHSDDIISCAWQYADTMQAEADKRLAEAEYKEEWQPDWNQAPDDLVKYFAVDENGRGGWFISKPTLCHDHWYWSDFEERVGNDCYDNAPSFNCTGDWRDSLRKRPN